MISVATASQSSCTVDSTGTSDVTVAARIGPTENAVTISAGSTVVNTTETGKKQ